MNRRLFDLVRAGVALGLLVMMIGGKAGADEPSEPLPGAERIGETVDLLEAQRSGDLDVEARGAGDDRVTIKMTNRSPRRLHVVIPPGLVASAGSGQFQSMGLGQPSNRPEAFGQFETPGLEGAGFRAIDLDEPTLENAVTVSPGQELVLGVPAVCLNLGLPDPKPTHQFSLMDVADYTPDPRVRKALRSLATLGTGRRVAQVVMWHVCNGYSLAQIAKVAPETANRWELALADRIIEAIDASTADPDLVDPAYLREGRVFVRVQADGPLEAEADRLASEVDGLYLLGLRSREVRGQGGVPTASGPALYLVVTLTSTTDSRVVGRVAVHGMARDGEWVNGGVAKLSAEAPAGSLDGAMLASAIDRAVAREFVEIRPIGRTASGTKLRIANGLPMTISGLVFDTAGDGSASVPVEALGLGPIREAEVVLPADDASVDRVSLNGL